MSMWRYALISIIMKEPLSRRASKRIQKITQKQI